MTWAAILVVAVVALGAMIRLLQLPRSGWELVGAALLFGLAGYALQGHPGMPSASKDAAESPRLSGEAEITERRLMSDKFATGQNWLILADALTRNGQYGAAADVLDKAVRKDPRNAEAWVALGNALVAHGDGLITPAAQFAYMRAAQIAPASPAPPFFLGLALAQSGKFAEARALWAAVLARAPADAAYRKDLAARLGRLDMLVRAQETGEMPAMPATGAPR